jgi:hypothetical protein
MSRVFLRANITTSGQKLALKSKDEVLSVKNLKEAVMKNLIFGLCLLSSFSALAGEAQIRVSLIAQEYTKDWKDIKLSNLNPLLKKKNLAPFADSIVLGKNDGKKWTAILDQITAANKALGRKIEVEDGGFYLDHRTPPFCYLGDGTGLEKTLEGLRDTFFAESMGIPGWRLGTKKVKFGGEWGPEGKDWMEQHTEENPNEVKAWMKYNTKSDAVLLLTDYGPQGDGMELFATLVQRCK